MRTHSSLSLVTITIVLVSLLAVTGPAAAQSASPFEIGVQLALVDSNELDGSDVGGGVRLGWLASPMFGVEAELNVYPRDLPDNGVSISKGRVEALFGVTFGPRYGLFRPFARLRPGLLRIQEAPEPVACILIFPPPLSCVLSGGKTLFALDLGGGVELNITDRTFGRVDIGDRLLRYPGPASDNDRTVHSDDFIGHDLRFTIGGGVRF